MYSHNSDHAARERKAWIAEQSRKYTSTTKRKHGYKAAPLARHTLIHDVYYLLVFIVSLLGGFWLIA